MFVTDIVDCEEEEEEEEGPRCCGKLCGRDHESLGGIRNMILVFGSNNNALQHLKS